MEPVTTQETIRRVSVVAWNVGHRAGTYPNLPVELVEALRCLDSDVVLLNEFYDDGRQDRERFRDQLCDIGYPYCDQSAADRKHNRVFIASRLPFERGDVPAPNGPTSHATTNFLHVRLKDSEIELIGLRRPAYTGVARRTYWEKTGETLDPSCERALVIAGDLNENIFKKAPDSVASVKFPFAQGYSVPRPDGEWSYTNPSGTSQTPIDHVVHTDRIRIRDPRYRYEIGGIALAASGPLKKVSLSDHAALTFIAEMARSVNPQLDVAGLGLLER